MNSHIAYSVKAEEEEYQVPGQFYFISSVSVFLDYHAYALNDKMEWYELMTSTAYRCIEGLKYNSTTSSETDITNCALMK
jgi:hypothetical protein